MKFSYNWLKELSGTEKSPEELAELLLSHAFEVEEMKPFEHGLGHVVVGEVMKVEAHPNADRLHVTEVMLGGIARTIVCGAPNVAVGQKVAVAMPGAKLPGGIAIEETEIRGVKSSGMICSEKELGLGLDASGILVLPSAAPDGVPIAELYGLEDTVLDVKILPNRGTDALSYFGLAREISALEGKAYSLEGNFEAPLAADTKPTLPESLRESLRAGGFSVAIEIAEACPTYVGLVFDVAPAKESFPLEMKGQLIVSGMRSIDPSTDITNYFLLLYGQPMHAFDADRIAGGAVTVRFAREGEMIALLDGSVKTLSTEDLVIADAEKPIALAGVMGGMDTAITADTKRVFLEMANFDRVLVRKTRIRHGLATDAAYRFEHGADPSWPKTLSGEVWGYFEMYAGATSALMLEAGSVESRTHEIRIAADRAEKVLGVPVPLGEMRRIFETLSLAVKESDGALVVTVPSFRPDLRDEWDLVEEIGRISGYDRIAGVAPVLPVALPPKNREKRTERAIKDYCADAGFDEVMTYSFVGVKGAELSGIPVAVHLELENPMNDDQRYLRTRLLPQAVEKVTENLRYLETFRFFEFGRTYAKVGDTIGEEKRVLLAMAGDEKRKGDIFFALKGEVENLLAHLRIRNVSFVQPEAVEPALHPSRVADIVAEGECVGAIGEANPVLFRKFGSGKRVAFAEFRFDRLLRHIGGDPIAETLAKYPSVNRDLAFLVPVKTLAADMIEAIREAGGVYLSDIALFDVYGSGKGTSMAFHLTFQSDERTLETVLVDDAIRSIAEAVETKRDGHLRA